MATLSHQERAERREQMAKAIKSGKKPSTVCRMFKVTLETVKNACREHGIEFPSTKQKASN